MRIKRRIIAGLAVCLGLMLGVGLVFAQRSHAANIIPVASDRAPDLATANFPVWWDEPDQASAQFGQSIRSAGDVNGDGYDDMIVGTHAYNHGTTQSGGAWLYYGSPAGFSITHDVDITLPTVTSSGFFGWAVGSANVNGDAYDDVMVSLINYDNSYSDEGAIFVWYGSETGFGASYDWMARGDAQYAHLGWDLGSAGDVNNDGYEDIIVGAVRYDYNSISHAYVWYGSENGLDPDGSRPVGLPGNADWQASAPTYETWSNPIWAGHGFGSRVGTAGDVNGDGYSDVFVGAPLYDNGSTELKEGAVFVWYSSETGLGDPGTIGNADWAAESDQAGAKLTGVNYNPLCGAGTAGDINNDGYDDFIVGSHLYSNTTTQEGIALLYLGSMDGLDPDGSRPVGNPQNTDWQAVSNQSYAGLGYEFGESGDLNNDGYDDILLSAYGYDITGTQAITNGGVGLMWFGGAQLPDVDGNPDNADMMFYSGNTNEYLGESIAWGGDVNNDGFDDVIAGAPFYSSNLGRAYLFYLALPILDLTAYNNSPTVVGDSTTLSATISAGTLVSYTWDFGDDFMAAGQMVTHTFQMWGTFTATVTASNPVTTTYASTIVTIEPLQVYLPLIPKVVP